MFSMSADVLPAVKKGCILFSHAVEIKVSIKGRLLETDAMLFTHT